jgi:hypothetical protein
MRMHQKQESRIENGPFFSMAAIIQPNPTQNSHLITPQHQTNHHT